MLDIAEFLLSVLAAGGTSAALVFLALRFFAVSWLENKFQEKLEAFRHENAKELQSLNAEIEGSLQKTVHAQKLEAETTAELWRLLNIAYGGVSDLVTKLKSFSKVANMSDNMLAEYLAQYDFFNSEIEDILNAENRQEKFEDRLYWYQYNKANKARTEFRNRLYLSEVFIDESLARNFHNILSNIDEAFQKYSVGKQAQDFKMMREASDLMSDGVRSEIEQLTGLVRTKLRER